MALVGGFVEHGGAVLWTEIRTLAAPLRRVVGHREEHLQNLTQRDLARVIDELHRFGVA